MSDKSRISVDDAYALETPAENIDLYRKWASTYDSDFAAAEGYVLYLHVAAQLLERWPQVSGTVLDVGCGTGLVGVALRAAGVGSIDGVDISNEMLAEACLKRTESGQPVYRDLISADLTQPIAIADNHYGALVSAGTFTHGHLGPDSLDELWRIAAPGALAVIGIRTTHFDQLGFAAKIADDVANGTITEPELVTVKIYGEGAGSGDHADDKTHIVVCNVV